MSRVTVHHLTMPARLPLIEEEGLRTRADLSALLGPVSAEDEAAPGRFAHGKRVSAFLDLDHARSQVEALGGGLVEFTVDPKKVIAAPSSARDDADPAVYWAAAKPLVEWGDDAPSDLEVHNNVGVRVKFVDLRAPLYGDDDLGEFAPLVAAVADQDRLSAKALMHLAVIAADGDFDSKVFKAACCLAWRDQPDVGELSRELAEVGADKVASTALAEFQAVAPEAVTVLRGALEDTIEWSQANDVELGQGILARTAVLLNKLG